ncbi:asparagine synthase (glutamine-hydrolyzing) [bacterium]|nr:asparagine synthase (glutamine-hydrolyzing) [bacterium]MBU1982815.1 asparagine synthase (glutamine-hydrolyzing) [bacterium]
MCGFTGEYLLQPDAAIGIGEHALRAERLRHRGPDACGSWNDDRLEMHHVRLKLLDPEHGLQPMQSGRGTVLSYNGEIYNNTELRAELTAYGCQFRTRSDTEVLLAAYDTWGEQAWERLNGMFAFALYDPARTKLYLVRDRLGIKPLFYRVTSRGLEFGSEPGAWDFSGAAHTALDPAGVIHFLRFAQPAFGGRSVYRDLRILDPGRQLTAADDGITVKRWHRPEESCASRETAGEAELRGYLRHLLHLAVGRQMIADAPVGVFLSGGMDSAILVGLLAQMRPEPPTTFTIALEGDEEDLLAARTVAKRWHCRHHELVITADEFFAGMAELIAIRQVPLSFPNEVLIYLLAKKAASQVKAVLTGEGADELFGGYTRIIGLLETYARAKEAADSGNPLLFRSLKAQWPLLDLSSDARFFISAYSWFKSEDIQGLLTDSYRHQWQPEKEERIFTEMLDSFSGHPLLHRYFMLLEYLHLPNLLSRLDGATMAASLEGRVPYTDTDLVRYVTCLPTHLKYIAGREDKPLLRRVFADIVPPTVLERPKRAFNASLEHLFASRPGQKHLAELRGNRQLLELVNCESLDTWTNGNGSVRCPLRSWLLLSLGMWLNRNIL